MLKLASLALALALVAAPAHADNAAAHTVSYADLNLNEPADRAVLHERVERAVNEVCGLYRGGDFRDVIACRYETRKELIEASSGLVRAALEERAPRARMAARE